jgi:hypothetical protein
MRLAERHQIHGGVLTKSEKLKSGIKTRGSSQFTPLLLLEKPEDFRVRLPRNSLIPTQDVMAEFREMRQKPCGNRVRVDLIPSQEEYARSLVEVGGASLDNHISCGQGVLTGRIQFATRAVQETKGLPLRGQEKARMTEPFILIVKGIEGQLALAEQVVQLPNPRITIKRDGQVVFKEHVDGQQGCTERGGEGG